MRERIAIAISILAVALLAALSLLFAWHQNPATAGYDARATDAPPPAAAPPAPAAEPHPAAEPPPAAPPPPAAEPPPPAAPPPAGALAGAAPQPPVGPPQGDSVAGHRVYRAWGCERCHSVQGVGSPRFPLDGVGARRTPDELYAWTVGGPTVQDSLSPSALRAKRRYEQVPEEDMRALIAWMRLLQQPRHRRAGTPGAVPARYRRSRTARRLPHAHERR